MENSANQVNKGRFALQPCHTEAYGISLFPEH